MYPPLIGKISLKKIEFLHLKQNINLILQQESLIIKVFLESERKVLYIGDFV